jgi:hypothetical protein
MCVSSGRTFKQRPGYAAAVTVQTLPFLQLAGRLYIVQLSIAVQLNIANSVGQMAPGGNSAGLSASVCMAGTLKSGVCGALLHRPLAAGQSCDAAQGLRRQHSPNAALAYCACGAARRLAGHARTTRWSGTRDSLYGRTAWAVKISLSAVSTHSLTSADQEIRPCSVGLRSVLPNGTSSGTYVLLWTNRFGLTTSCTTSKSALLTGLAPPLLL